MIALLIAALPIDPCAPVKPKHHAPAAHVVHHAPAAHVVHHAPQGATPTVVHKAKPRHVRKPICGKPAALTPTFIPKQPEVELPNSPVPDIDVTPEAPPAIPPPQPELATPLPPVQITETYAPPDLLQPLPSPQGGFVPYTAVVPSRSVPEPPALALFGLALVIVGSLNWRKM